MIIRVFCDGSAGEKGTIAWAYKIVDENDCELLSESACARQYEKQNGNAHKAEVFAMYFALKAVKDKSLKTENTQVELYSDSTYAISVAKGQIAGFDKHISKKMRSLARNMCDSIFWIKGHSGNIHHDDCDRRASQERKRLLRSVLAAESLKEIRSDCAIIDECMGKLSGNGTTT